MDEVDELAPILLDGVSIENTCHEEGHCGSYGFVIEAKIGKTVYVAKKPHSYFLRRTSDREKNDVISKFRTECLLLSNLRHPNIVQFIGVHYGPSGRDDISLVMEKLVCDLAAFLEDNQEVKKMTKLIILQDVSYGLVYLHEYKPTIIHRDLSARNILLTPDYHAKIADVGMAKMMDERARQAEIQTQTPGQLYYMPPEARKRRSNYTSKLDMFSFGHLSLHTVLGEYPILYEDDITPDIVQQGISEIKKRQISLDRCKSGSLDCLYPTIVNCLMDNPEQRPTAREINMGLNNLVLQIGQHEKQVSHVEQIEILKKELIERNQELADVEENLLVAEETKRQLQQLVEEMRCTSDSQEEAKVLEHDLRQERKYYREQAQSKVQETKGHHKHQPDLQQVLRMDTLQERISELEYDTIAKSQQLKQYEKLVDLLQDKLKAHKEVSLAQKEQIESIVDERERVKKKGG